jgi:hypothetical protein
MDFEALDPAYVAEVLSRAPFVPLDGTFNVRDIHHTQDTKTFKLCKCHGNVRPGFIFRSGELSALTEHGEYLLASLHHIMNIRQDLNNYAKRESKPSLTYDPSPKCTSMAAHGFL